MNDRRYLNENGEIKYGDIKEYFIKERVAEIDNYKLMLAQKSKKFLKRKTTNKDEAQSRD